jgi:hypothetical protein
MILRQREALGKKSNQSAPIIAKAITWRENSPAKIMEVKSLRWRGTQVTESVRGINFLRRKEQSSQVHAACFFPTLSLSKQYVMMVFAGHTRTLHIDGARKREREHI